MKVLITGSIVSDTAPILEFKILAAAKELGGPISEVLLAEHGVLETRLISYFNELKIPVTIIKGQPRTVSGLNASRLRALFSANAVFLYQTKKDSCKLIIENCKALGIPCKVLASLSK